MTEPYNTVMQIRAFARLGALLMNSSRLDTHRGAQQYERQVREALLAGTLGKEVKEVPTLESFRSGSSTTRW